MPESPSSSFHSSSNNLLRKGGLLSGIQSTRGYLEEVRNLHKKGSSLNLHKQGHLLSPHERERTRTCSTTIPTGSNGISISSSSTGENSSMGVNTRY